MRHEAAEPVLAWIPASTGPGPVATDRDAGEASEKRFVLTAAVKEEVFVL
jgi:hypothetical protein